MLSKIIDKAISQRFPERSSDAIREEVKARHDRLGDLQARRFVRGNVNIQQGSYIVKTSRKGSAS
jgi:hypothetical protein